MEVPNENFTPASRLRPGATQQEPRTAIDRWRKIVPPLVSGGLVGWLVWRVSPHELAQVASQLNWPLLVPLTMILVLAMYLWDGACLRSLFGQSNHAVTCGVALHARGTSYLAGVLNYGLGQAMLAWLMAKAQGITLTSALSRLVLLACHDVFVLLTLGLFGSLASTDPRVQWIRVFSAVGVTALLGLAILWSSMPTRWRTRATQIRWAASFASWSWRRSVPLLLLRTGYFGIMLVYAAVALKLCGIHLDRSVVMSVIPLVLLADGLPISVSGLGTREAALLYLLKPERPEVVLALSLIWSTGLMTGRLAIGLGNLWVSHFAVGLAGRADPLGEQAAHDMVCQDS